jgi:hypothetical protein
MAFNPDEFLSKYGGFNPDEFLGETPTLTPTPVSAPSPVPTPSALIGFEPSRLGAIGRGAAQGVSLGFADEATAGIRALYDYLTNKYGSEKGLGDIYGQEVAESRAKDVATREAFPWTMGAAEVAGAVAPVIGATLLSAPAGGSGGVAAGAGTAARILSPTTVRGLAALGGVAGLGYSESPDIAGKVADIGKGAIIGAAVPKAIQGVGKLAGRAGMAALRGMTGVGRKTAETFMENPAAVKGSFEAIAERIPKRLEILDDMIARGSKEARGHLSGLRGATSLDDIVGKLQRMKGDIRIGGGELSGMEASEFGPAAKKTGKLLDEMIDDVKRLRTVEEKGIKNYISERDVRQIMDRLDGEINWADPAISEQNSMLAGMRSYLDNVLKSSNDAYRNAMAPLAEKIRAKEGMMKQFGIKRMTGQGYMPGDLTVTKLKGAVKEPRIGTRRTLKRFGEATGGDIMPEIQMASAAEEFKTAVPSGIPFGGGKGGWLAQSFEPGESGELAKKILEPVRNIGQSKLMKILTGSPQVFGEYAPALQAAARRGSHALATTHYILQQQDRDYAKKWEELDMENKDGNFGR